MTLNERMKTRTAQLAAIVGIVIATALLATPWVLAATSTTSTSTTSTSSTGTSSSTSNQTYLPCPQGRGSGWGSATSTWSGLPGREFGLRSTVNLAVGQTITVTSSQGSYHVVGTPSNNGTASGSVTFTVTSKLSEGYTLSITSGSIVVGGTTYTISSGSAQTGPLADAISGQGTTTPTGQFLLQGLARGSFAGTTGLLHLDFEAGSTEYAVTLIGTVQS